MAKVVVADALHKAVDTSLQLLGARGYSKDTPVEWMYRYARQARLVDGASRGAPHGAGQLPAPRGQGLLRLGRRAWMRQPARACAAWLRAAAGDAGRCITAHGAAVRRRDPAELGAGRDAWRRAGALGAAAPTMPRCSPSPCRAPPNIALLRAAHAAPA